MGIWGCVHDFLLHVVCRRVSDFKNKVFLPKVWVQGFNFIRGHLLFQTISVSRRTVPEAGLSLMKCFVNVVLGEMALMM